MKLKLQKHITTTEEVEVEFPIYRDHSDILDHGGFDQFYRIGEDGRYWMISKMYSFSSRDPVEYEVKSGTMDIEQQLSSYLTRGSKATEDEFNALLQEMREQLGQFPG